MEQSDIYMRKNKPWQIPHAKHKVDFNIKFKTKTTSFIVENRKKNKTSLWPWGRSNIFG